MCCLFGVKLMLFDIVMWGRIVVMLSLVFICSRFVVFGVEL